MTLTGLERFITHTHTHTHTQTHTPAFLKKAPSQLEDLHRAAVEPRHHHRRLGRPQKGGSGRPACPPHVKWGRCGAVKFLIFFVKFYVAPWYKFYVRGMQIFSGAHQEKTCLTANTTCWLYGFPSSLHGKTSPRHQGPCLRNHLLWVEFGHQGSPPVWQKRGNGRRCQFVSEPWVAPS